MAHANPGERRQKAALSAILPRVEAPGEFRRLVASCDGLPTVVLASRAEDGYVLESDGTAREIAAASLEGELRRLAETGYSEFAVERITGVARVLISESGVRVSYADSCPGSGAGDISNVDKSYLVKAGEADELLRAVGIMTADGRIKAGMRAKFRQVNHFIELIRPQLQEAAGQTQVVVLDLGCGKSYLSFVVNYFLRAKLKANCRVIGIDSNPDLIRKSEALRQRLGYSNMAFHTATIDEFVGREPVDFVLSLHACDTATDEAIAKGVELAARWIVAAPCCQHELADHIQAEPLSPLTKHAMFRMALADTATDALRALALEAMGYRVDVLEFVRPDVTPKNIMLRAERAQASGRRQTNKPALEEFRRLKGFLGVDPKIQQLIPRLAG
jgi:hypothetical protein